MFSHLDVALSPRELVTRTVRESMSDDAQGLASQLAYYFFLALFPALLCMLAIASFFPLQHFTDDMLRILGPFAPDEVLAIFRQEMLKIAEAQHGGLLTIGLLGALWSSSSAITALISAMNRAYDIEESRAWWRVRLRAICMTVALSVLVILAFTLIVIGPQLADFVGRQVGMSGMLLWTWKIVQWPLAFVMVAVGISLIYYFAPDAEQVWVWITPGSLVATCLWLLGSLAFRFYAVHFGHYEATYGAVGGIILLMLWFYWSGLSLVIGAELNAEIEHASPWGKAPGEKIPGQKKRIGAAAARAYHARAQRPRRGEPAPPLAPPPSASPSPRRAPLWQRVAAVAALVVLWRLRRRRPHHG